MKAFPTQIENHTAFGEQGMDLRDYFAAKAMPMIADFLRQEYTKDFCMPFDFDNSVDLEMLAVRCYGLADAMMEARKK